MEKVQWNSINKKQNGLKYLKNDKSFILPTPLFIIKGKRQVGKLPAYIYIQLYLYKAGMKILSIQNVWTVTEFHRHSPRSWIPEVI